MKGAYENGVLWLVFLDAWGGGRRMLVGERANCDGLKGAFFPGEDFAGGGIGFAFETVFEVAGEIVEDGGFGGEDVEGVAIGRGDPDFGAEGGLEEEGEGGGDDEGGVDGSVAAIDGVDDLTLCITDPFGFEFLEEAVGHGAGAFGEGFRADADGEQFVGGVGGDERGFGDFFGRGDNGVFGAFEVDGARGAHDVRLG